jgi:hypothetical protein
MDEERITRIARAMCRAARIDPDKPAGDGDPAGAAMRKMDQGEPRPAWMLFRREARLFALRHRDVAIRL